MDTPVENLRLICGADDILGIANPKSTQKTRLFNHLKKLDADVILLDLGAGTSFTTIEQVFLALAGKIPALHDLTLDKIGDLGVPVVDTGYQIPLLEKERARKAQGLIVG